MDKQKYGSALQKMVEILGILIMLVIIAGMAVVLDLALYAREPVSGHSREKVVAIPPGSRFDSTSSVLQQSGLVGSPIRFKIVAMASGYDKRIKAGEYLLHTHMSPLEILEKLVDGKERLIRVTVPEGCTMIQVADILEKRGWTFRERFLDLVNDRAFVGSLELEAPSLEGYLFPDTYLFPRNVRPEKMIACMVDRFKFTFSPDWTNRAKELGLTRHQAVTLASIIEKETGASFERPLIASVFHNRLKRGMRLESDPTVIYDIPEFDGNITRKHLEAATPYNTYKIEGLPPGPIANPGKASLEAALYPSKTDYLFFVSKKDRTHFFSTNFKDHVHAVREYQLKK